jgi:hypothetical protein
MMAIAASCGRLQHYRATDMSDELSHHRSRIYATTGASMAWPQQLTVFRNYYYLVLPIDRVLLIHVYDAAF